MFLPAEDRSGPQMRRLYLWVVVVEVVVIAGLWALGAAYR